MKRTVEAFESQMTKDEIIARAELIDVLKRSGNRTFAEILEYSELHLTNNPKTRTAYMKPGTNKIWMSAKLPLEERIVTIKHEILHRVLQHGERFAAYCEQMGYTDAHKAYAWQFVNYAGDYEISNHAYDDADKRKMGGHYDPTTNKRVGEYRTGYVDELTGIAETVICLVTEYDHPEWVNWTFEEMLQALEAEHPYAEPENQEQTEKPEDAEQDELEFTPGYMNGNDDVVSAFKNGDLKYDKNRECLVDRNGNEIYDAASFEAAGLAHKKGQAPDTFAENLSEAKIRQEGGYDQGVADTIQSILDAIQGGMQQPSDQSQPQPKDPRQKPKSQPQDSQDSQSDDDNSFDIPDMSDKQKPLTKDKNQSGDSNSNPQVNPETGEPADGNSENTENGSGDKSDKQDDNQSNSQSDEKPGEGQDSSGQQDSGNEQSGEEQSGDSSGQGDGEQSDQDQSQPSMGKGSGSAQQPQQGNFGNGEMTDEEEAAEMERIQREIEAQKDELRGAGINPESEEDLEKARKHANDLLSGGPQTLNKIKSDIKLRKDQEDELKRLQADKLAKQRGSGSFNDCLTDLHDFINLSTSKQYKDSFGRPNPTYAGTNILVPGRQKENKKYSAPTINFYLDKSNSFRGPQNEWKKKMFNQAINTVKPFESNGRVKIKPFYFGEEISNDATYEGNSDQGQIVLSHIQATKPDNVIILTDNDLSGLNWSVEVPGGVWIVAIDDPEYTRGGDPRPTSLINSLISKCNHKRIYTIKK